MVQVLIVDDSRTARLALRQALERDPDILVTAEAASGDEGMRLIERLQPDLVTMDVHLTGESGLDVTARIMDQSPRPILIVTGADIDDPTLAYRAMQNGALEVCSKLPSPVHPTYEQERIKLSRLIKSVARIRVLHQGRASTASNRCEVTQPVAGPTKTSREPIGAILIGASTGGPPLIGSMLAELPAPLPIPVVVVQHISDGFATGFAEWLGQVSGHRTVVVRGQVSLVPGTVYVAPDDRNVVFAARNLLRCVDPSDPTRIRPSIDELFRSAAGHLGARAIAVLLTGMGKDGATGLKALRDAGARTIVQEPTSCVVDSMPRSALALDAAELTMDPEEIGACLRHFVPLPPARIRDWS